MPDHVWKSLNMPKSAWTVFVLHFPICFKIPTWTRSYLFRRLQETRGYSLKEHEAVFLNRQNVATDHRVSDFLFASYFSFLSFFLQSCFLHVYTKNAFSRKIFPEKSTDLLLLFVCKVQSSYFQTFLQCSIIFLEFSRMFATRNLIFSIPAGSISFVFCSGLNIFTSKI